MKNTIKREQSKLVCFDEREISRLKGKTFLATMMALVLTIAAQGQEAIDTAQFVAAYDYECRTQNDEAASVTDRMQVVVQVGRTVTKSMPRSAYPVYDDESKPDVAAGFQEALMHMPTVWTGLPTGQTTVREFIFPHEYEGYERLRVGDGTSGIMMTLLTEPMQVDYRTVRTSSGIIGESNSWHTSGDWKWQLPRGRCQLQFWQQRAGGE